MFDESYCETFPWSLPFARRYLCPYDLEAAKLQRLELVLLS